MLKLLTYYNYFCTICMSISGEDIFDGQNIHLNLSVFGLKLLLQFYIFVMTMPKWFIKSESMHLGPHHKYFTFNNKITLTILWMKWPFVKKSPYYLPFQGYNSFSHQINCVCSLMAHHMWSIQHRNTQEVKEFSNINQNMSIFYCVPWL